MWNQIKKEWLISIRTNGIMVLFIVLIQAILPFLMGKELYELVTDQELLKQMLSNTMLYFPLMSMPLTAMLLAEAVMSEERKERILQVLFANGVEINIIWKSKIIFAFAISYVVNAICILLALIYLRITYGVWVTMDWYHGGIVFGIFPILALAVIDIMVTLLWISKTARLYVGFLPSISYIGLMYLSTVKSDLFSRFLTVEMAIGVIISVLLIVVVTECIINKLSKEYLINVNS